jgi:hypothetical protein
MAMVVFAITQRSDLYLMKMISVDAPLRPVVYYQYDSSIFLDHLENSNSKLEPSARSVGVHQVQAYVVRCYVLYPIRRVKFFSVHDMHVAVA